MAGCHDRKGVIGDVGGKRDIGIAERGIDEVVVMRGEEQPARNALGNPLLMQHQAVVIGDAQIEQRGLARNNEVKAVLCPRSAERGRELLTLLAEEARRVELFHLVDGGDAGGKRHGAHPVRAGEGERRRRRTQEFLPAGRRHVVAVGKRLAEADDVRLDAVIMVAARKVEAEAGAHIVEDQHDAVLVAELAHSLPFFLCGADIVVEIAVVVGLCDQRRDVALVLLPDACERVHVKPRDDDVVCHVLGQDAGVVRLHRPGVVAVVIALEEDRLLALGVRTGAEHGEGRRIGAIFHKVCPVGAGDRIHQQLGALHHLVGGRGRAVACLQLFQRGGVHIRVIVAEDIRTVGTHHIDVAVAVHVPEVGALGAGADERPLFKRQEQPLGRTEMPVDARGNDIQRAVKPRAALLMCVFGKSAHCTAPLTQVDRHAVENAVDVVHHGQHAGKPDVALAHFIDGGDLAVKQSVCKVDVGKFHQCARIFRRRFDRGEDMIAHADGHGGDVPDAERNIAVRRIFGGDLRDGIRIGKPRDRARDDVHRHQRVFFKECAVGKRRLVGAQHGGKPIGELCERTGQERQQRDHALDRHAGLARVDHAVECGGRRKVHLAGAAVAPLCHAAALCGKVKGAAGAVLHVKAERHGLFDRLHDRLCLGIQHAQVLQCAEHAVHIHIRHCLLFGHLYSLPIGCKIGQNKK